MKGDIISKEVWHNNIWGKETKMLEIDRNQNATIPFLQ